MYGIPTLDDVIIAANVDAGQLPQLGEVWRQLDGKLVKVIDISTNRFGPLELRYLSGGHAGYRTRDGRYVLFGKRGCDAKDLMEIVTDDAGVM
jgi:hypothetical protein